MPSDADSITDLTERVWNGSIPLHIALSPNECRTYDDSLPYLIQYPRLSYLPFLLPRVHQFFAQSLINPDVGFQEGWFSYQGVPLKWQHPLGLLYDIFSGAEPTNPHDFEMKKGRSEGVSNTPGRNETIPWKLVLHFTEWPSEFLMPLDNEGKHHHDAFINSVKEADFLRNGTAKTMMSLSKEDSTKLWLAVEEHDLPSFDSIHQKLLHPSDGAPLRHIPVKVYLPTSPSMTAPTPEEQSRGTLKVVQTLLKPMLTHREPQTLGTALHSLLPTVFPSRRSYIYAQAVLHGVVVPLTTPLERLMRAASYADGFLHFSVVMVS